MFGVFMNSRYASSSARPADVVGIQFGILSKEEIVKQSVVCVHNVDLYDKGEPAEHGLYDLRMGTTSRSNKCATCGCDNINCPGHFGHVELEYPVYNLSYFKNIYKILQCVCMRCSGFLGCFEKFPPLPTENVSGSRRAMRLKRVMESLKKDQMCARCEFRQPKWSTDNFVISCTFTNANEEPEDENAEATTTTAVPTKTILNVLRKMDDDTCDAIGSNSKYSHPKNMIFEVFPVSPPVIRPSVMMNSSYRTQDDITHKMTDILKCNKSLAKLLGSNPKGSEPMIQETISLLQYHVNTLIDNEIPGQPQATQRTGRPIKSIGQRIRSKEGRVRGNLMGKRVDFSARTVITAEPNIMLDELGVPVNIARNMTFSECVNAHNKKRIQDYVDTGPCPKRLKDVGAKYVITENGVRKDLRFAKDVVVNEGDVVERHLKDGDYVVFNRQPTLHKMSMMGHRVVVMPHNTFRMNLSATSSYNADFDGDEMNLHVAQGYESISEIKELMMVSKNMISPQANRPVMGIIQDSLMACRLFTKRDVFLAREDVTQLLCNIEEFRIPIPCVLKPIPLWSGKQLMSLLFFPGLQMRKYSAWHNEDTETPWFSASDTEIYIDASGELLTGTLCKKTLGAASNGIVHKAWLIDNDKACRLVSRIQFLVNKWLLTHGFSVGISDCVTKNTGEVTSLIDDNMRRIDTILENAVKTGVHPSKKEGTISTILNNARDVSGRYVQKDLTTNNNLFTMVSGGSKGSVINIAQIMACVGQQNVNGQRVAFGYDNRTLPHFKQNDHGPESKGFVKHSYMQGLTPSEFFFHAMGGREGVIDTAIKTSESGYIQRRLVKSMEDIAVGFDGVVRNSIGDIVQFRYGEDGFDGSLLFAQKIDKSNPWGMGSICFPIELTDAYWKSHDNTDTTSVSNIKNVSPLADWLIRRHVRDEQQAERKRLQMNAELEPYLVNPGEMVGVIAAQSLGQPITQMTLNTFHFSGIASKSVTLGVPRLKELINMSKTIKSPSMTIAMKPEHVHSKMFRFNGTTLGHYVKGTSVHYRLEMFDFEQDYLKRMENPDLESALRDGCWVIVFAIDVYEVGKQGVTMTDLTVCLQQQYDNVWCVCNDETSEEPMLVVRVMTSADAEDNDHAKRLAVKIKSDLNVKGYPNIRETYAHDDPLVVETAGTDFENVLCDRMIDPHRTYTNNIIETYQVLGIEAAREMLLREIRNVIEYDGSYVDYRHVGLLVDTMTYKGMLMSITRHGINRTETGVLMRCSFEETVNIITDAAVFGERDHLKGITENIVMGKHSKIGTGLVDILVDPARMIPDFEPSVDVEEPLHQHDCDDVYIPSTPRHEFEDTCYVDSFYT